MVEDEDEEPQEQEVDLPAPAPALELLQEEPEDEEYVEVVEVENDEEEDAAQEDAPPPAMGWTTKTYDKPGCDCSASHHRLLGILQTYYADWAQLWSMSTTSIHPPGGHLLED